MAEYIEKQKLLNDTRIYKDDNGVVRTHKFVFRNYIESLPTTTAIPISDNATNGDMIKTLFPNYEETRMCGDVRYGSKEYYNLEFVVDEDWWDAPYKRGVK